MKLRKKKNCEEEAKQFVAKLGHFENITNHA
jgi:hypothetical protein